MTDRLLNGLLGAVAVCLVLLTGMRVSEWRVARAHAAESGPTRVEDWQEYAAAGLTTGSADAPVRIVVFSDYQCPACRQLDASLAALTADDDRIAVTWRHFPLQSIHPHAAAAARAAECAEAGGHRPALHRRLFERPDDIGVLPWEKLAEEAGMDGDAAARLAECVASGRFEERLRQDLAAATELGVSATPTFLINETRYVGAPAPAELERRIREALRRQ